MVLGSRQCNLSDPRGSGNLPEHLEEARARPRQAPPAAPRRRRPGAALLVDRRVARHGHYVLQAARPARRRRLQHGGRQQLLRPGSPVHVPLAVCSHRRVRCRGGAARAGCFVV